MNPKLTKTKIGIFQKRKIFKNKVEKTRAPREEDAKKTRAQNKQTNERAILIDDDDDDFAVAERIVKFFGRYYY